MAQVLFDKTVYMDRLKVAGIPDDQARAHADAMDEALKESVATKADIAELRASTQAGFSAVRADIAALEARLTVRMGIGAVAIVSFLTAIKFFGHG